MTLSSSRRVRILHVLPWFISGGVERRRVELITKLDAQRYEQHVICKEAHGALFEQLEERGTPIHLIEGKWDLFDIEAMAGIIDYIDKWQPDIIHGAVFEGVTMSSFCGYLAGVPHVVIEETGGTRWRSWRGDFLLAFNALLADRCIAVSPHIGRYLAERSQLRAPKLKVISNGITLKPAPTKRASARFRKDLGIPKDALVVGSLGRVFDEFKRFSDLIRAFAKLSPEADGRPVYLVIGGDGPDWHALRELADSLHLSERVILPGYIDAPHMLYSVMDIFALVSASESFGLVLVEAMSTGLPVIASRVDAFPDIVDEGESGLLVPVRDPEALAAALTELLEDEALRKKLGTQAKKVATRDYSTQRYVSDVDAFYQSLLHGEQTDV